MLHAFIGFFVFGGSRCILTMSLNDSKWRLVSGTKTRLDYDLKWRLVCRTKTSVDYSVNGTGPGAATSPPPFTSDDVFDSMDPCEVRCQGFQHRSEAGCRC